MNERETFVFRHRLVVTLLLLALLGVALAAIVLARPGDALDRSEGQAGTLLYYDEGSWFCLGNGAASFVCGAIGSDNFYNESVALGDVNDDGNVDAVFAADIGRNQVCLGDGSGGWACDDILSETADALSHDVALGDVNGDGNIDAVFAADIGRSQVCLGDGTGAWICTAIPVSGYAQGVALGDVDGDGNLDAVFAGSLSQVCLGDGMGEWLCTAILGGNASGVALGDVDGDGNLDAVFAVNAGNQDSQVCVGDGSGGFLCADVLLGGADWSSVDVALGDLNGDGNLDAVFARGYTYNHVCLGDGSGDLDCARNSQVGFSWDVALGDVDGDGNLDAVFAKWGSAIHLSDTSHFRDRVCLGDGLGALACDTMTLEMGWSEGVALGDVDGDGNLDAIVAGRRGPSFLDTAAIQFVDDIEWVAGQGITVGCNPKGTLYCPLDSVTRAQMASFLVRALNLPAVAGNRFTDVSGTHLANINALAEAGITIGCNADGTLYCPNDSVSRAQVGSFLARALLLDPIPGERFDDVSGVHEANINAISQEGITLGCNSDGTLYCPNNPVTRGQMAAFLHRALG